MTDWTRRGVIGAGMTALASSDQIELPESPTRGSTTLQDYVEALVTNA